MCGVPVSFIDFRLKVISRSPLWLVGNVVTFHPRGPGSIPDLLICILAFIITGHIGMTFYKENPIESKDPFSMERRTKHPMRLSGLNPSDEAYANSKWCYDTPGAVHPEQVVLISV